MHAMQFASSMDTNSRDLELQLNTLMADDLVEEMVVMVETLVIQGEAMVEAGTTIAIEEIEITIGTVTGIMTEIATVCVTIENVIEETKTTTETVIGIMGGEEDMVGVEDTVLHTTPNIASPSQVYHKAAHGKI